MLPPALVAIDLNRWHGMGGAGNCCPGGSTSATTSSGWGGEADCPGGVTSSTRAPLRSCVWPTSSNSAITVAASSPSSPMMSLTTCRAVTIAAIVTSLRTTHPVPEPPTAAPEPPPARTDRRQTERLHAFTRLDHFLSSQSSRPDPPSPESMAGGPLWGPRRRNATPRQPDAVGPPAETEQPPPPRRRLQRRRTAVSPATAASLHMRLPLPERCRHRGGAPQAAERALRALKGGWGRAPPPRLPRPFQQRKSASPATGRL